MSSPSPVDLAIADQGDGPPIVILHGLFGSGRNWAGITDRLAQRWRVVTVDLRNHGASPWSPAMGYPEMAADVLALIRDRVGAPVRLVGHSMGGKTAMVAALTEPAAIARLAVVDIAPVSNPPTLLAYARAMRALDLGAITRRGEADRLLAEAVPNMAERGFLLQNLLFEDGRARWRLNLEAIEAGFDQIADFPLAPGEAAYEGPTLFIAGAKSTYVRPADEPIIREYFPSVEIVRIPNAGHWVHAEAPQPFLAALEPFLAGDRHLEASAQRVKMPPA